MNGDPVKVYRQAKTAIESSIVTRECPVCGVVGDIEIAEMVDGWELWRCVANGCRKEYRVT